MTTVGKEESFIKNSGRGITLERVYIIFCSAVGLGKKIC